MKQLNLTIENRTQLNKLAGILNENVGKPQEAWRFRKVMANGEINTGKRCRIIKHLDKGKKIKLVVEVFENEDKVSEEDLMFVVLSCGN